jgi:hypothetical protein
VQASISTSFKRSQRRVSWITRSPGWPEPSKTAQRDRFAVRPAFGGLSPNNKT